MPEYNRRPARPEGTLRFLTAACSVAILLTACRFLPESLLGAAAAASEQYRTKAPQLLWSDEFDGHGLDLSKWEYRALGPRRDAVNVKEAVELDGEGHLLIITSKGDTTYHTGMIGTQNTFEHTFGYWEARMRFQKEQGHWSAFWLQSPTVGEVGDPRTNGTEIDIIEYLRNRANIVQNALHWDGYGAEHKSTNNRFYFPGLGDGFHRIGLEWTPEEYVFYVDDREVWRTTEAVSHRPQYAILSLEVGPWAGDIAQAALPDTLFVDYLRVYDSRPSTPK